MFSRITGLAIKGFITEQVTVKEISISTEDSSLLACYATLTGKY
jgi:hypothetical protein